MFTKVFQYKRVEVPTEKSDIDTNALLSEDESEAIRTKWHSAPARIITFHRLALFMFGVAVGVALAVVVSQASFKINHCQTSQPSRIDRFSVGRRDILFLNDSRYVNDDMWHDKKRTHEALHEWVLLSSKDRGVVKIAPEERGGLPPPVEFGRDLGGSQAVYFTSAFHQLHCLSSIMQSYAGLVRGEPETGHGNGLSHITHCFDYIRQGILCSGDTTLEGRAIHEGEKLPIGWGSYHDCKDWTQIVDWADSRQPWDGPYYRDFL